MYSWTVDDVLALGPCPEYTREQLEQLAAGRESLGIREVCDLDIPAKDRIWLLCRAPWAVIEPAITAIVERAVRTHALTHEATRVWAERWLSGEDRSAEAARTAAEAAWDARAAARAARAAGAAAWASAWAAWDAGLAAEAAAWASAWAAGLAAEAAGAAGAAERERQLDDFRALEGGDDD